MCKILMFSDVKISIEMNATLTKGEHFESEFIYVEEKLKNLLYKMFYCIKF